MWRNTKMSADLVTFTKEIFKGNFYLLQRRIQKPVKHLTLLWWRSLSYKNQPIYLQRKSMDRFLYDSDLYMIRIELFRKNSEHLSIVDYFHKKSHIAGFTGVLACLYYEWCISQTANHHVDRKKWSSVTLFSKNLNVKLAGVIRFKLNFHYTKNEFFHHGFSE